MDGDRFSQSTQKLIRKCLCLFCAFAVLAMVIGPTVVIPATPFNAISPQVISVPQTCTELGPSSLGAASLKDRIWKGKDTLRVRFLGGSDFLRERVRYYAQFW